MQLDTHATRPARMKVATVVTHVAELGVFLAAAAALGMGLLGLR
jgi:hypothetical protein